jgi:hypothetical protein
MAVYEHYYANQVGGRVGSVYRAPLIGYQKGKGLGSVFAGVYRFLKPLLLNSGKFLGKEAMKSLPNILEGISDNKPIKTILQDEKNRTLKGLAKRIRDNSDMTGSGLFPTIKRRRTRKKRSTSTVAIKRKTRRRRKKTVRPKGVTKRRRRVKKRSLNKSAFLKSVFGKTQ